MSDLVGNPDDRFSHNEAHIIECFTLYDLDDLTSVASHESIDQNCWKTIWDTLEERRN